MLDKLTNTSMEMEGYCLALDSLAEPVILCDASESHNIIFLNAAAGKRLKQNHKKTPSIEAIGLPVMALFRDKDKLLAMFERACVEPHREQLALSSNARRVTITPLFSSRSPEKAGYFLMRWDAQAEPFTDPMLSIHAARDIFPRDLLLERMRAAMAETRRRETLLAILFVDLDGFKVITDKFDPAGSAELLKDVAHRIARVVRAEDTVAHLGIDQFILLLGDIPDMDRLEELIRRIMGALRAPFPPLAENVVVTASIGVTLFPLDEGDEEMLLRHAELAMYQAKTEGRAQHHLFSINRERSLRAKQALRERLVIALRQEEFRLYYQPQVNMRTGQVVALESLIRWHDPDRGLVAPEEFLYAAEESDLILGIGHWVLKKALTQADVWKQQDIAIRIAVNVAARQFTASSFMDELSGVLDRYDVTSGQLELEITESSSLHDVKTVQRIIAECHRKGVRVALDDFGTGYSTLKYLQHLAANLVKIDQGFVRGMLENSDDAAIVEGVIAMANLTKREVLAEGVETPDHGIMLMRLGCDFAQGYAIARPMPAEEVPQWLMEWRGEPRWQTASTARWDIRDFPLLVAKHSHVMWVNRVIRTLYDPSVEIDVSEITDHHQCGLGRWYDNEGQQRYGHLAAFGELGKIHRKVHETGIRIVTTCRQADQAESEKLESELLGLKEQVLAKLTVLHDLVEQAQA